MGSATLNSKLRPIALGYAVFAITYFALFSIIIDAGGLRMFRHLDLVGDILSLLVSLFLINALLSFGSFRYVALSSFSRTLVLAGASALAVIYWGILLYGTWRWIRGELGPGVGVVNVAVFALAPIGYTLSAYALARVRRTL